MLLAITRKVPGPVFGRNRTYVDMAARCSKALARSLHRLHIFGALCPICAENREKVVLDTESPPFVDRLSPVCPGILSFVK